MAKSDIGVLILHGLSASLDCVEPIEAGLAPLGLPVRMPLLRGHGAPSPEALREVVWQDWVADGEAALQDLLTEADRAIVVGHSMGALVAITLGAADRASAPMDSLVLAAPPIRLASPLAEGNALSFLRPIVTRLLRKWDMPPNYADKSLEAQDTNYPWIPMSTVQQFLDFAAATRGRLSEVRVPLMVLQSRNDSTVDPRSAEILIAESGTPDDQKEIVWFEETEHDMFRDCEREAAVAAVVDFVRDRLEVRGDR